jgi:hypothetical protein
MTKLYNGRLYFTLYNIPEPRICLASHLKFQYLVERNLAYNWFCKFDEIPFQFYFRLAIKDSHSFGELVGRFKLV